MKLSNELFSTVVAHAPLISIDLVLVSADDKVLLGERMNRPAQGFWFVPGGRVHKDERLDDALTRLIRAELGNHVPVAGWKFIGLYEHHYPDDSHVALRGVNTHYVVAGLTLRLSAPADNVQIDARDQHVVERWWSVPELMGSAAVHDNTKAYFIPGRYWLG